MQTLTGERVYLRALEPEDLSLLYDIENNEENWEVSQTQTPYSRFIIKQYLENAHRDIDEVKQLRMVICNNEGIAVGLVDLFDFDPKNKKVGLGIFILESARKQHYAFEAIELILKYAFKHLSLHQVYAHVLETNTASVQLFKKLDFQVTNVQKDWVFENNEYHNQYLFQYINYVH